MLNTVAVVGLLGSGKSILCKQLAEALEWELHPEPFASIDFIPLVYSDPAKYGFACQVQMLTATVAQSLKTGVLDGSYLLSHAYSRAYLRDGEYEMYLSLVKTLLPVVKQPDLLVWLDVSLLTCLERIQSRAKPMEQEVTLDFLHQLREETEKQFKQFDGNKLKFDYEDFAASPAIVNVVKEYVVTTGSK